MKAKEFWLASSAGILKNALCKSITVKNLEPVGMGVSDLGKLERTGCQGMTMFIAQRS